MSDVRSQGKICVLDIEMQVCSHLLLKSSNVQPPFLLQGVKSIEQTDLNPVYVFLRPPSLEELEKRLRGRGTETEESLSKRLDTAKRELEFGATPGVFDYTIVNGNLDKAIQEFTDIITNEFGSFINTSSKSQNP